MSRYNFTSTFGGYDNYNTFSLEKHTVKDLRKEYRKLRKEAIKRIEELKNSEFSESKILENKEYLNVDPNSFDKDELVRMLSYTASFLASSQSTPEGQRTRIDRAVETLNIMGYTNINRDNFDEFAKYMDYLHTYIDNQILSSEKLLDLFDASMEEGTPVEDLAGLVNKTQSSNITLTNLKRNLEFYNKNIKNIERLDLNPTRKRHYTARELRKKLSKKDMLIE